MTEKIKLTLPAILEKSFINFSDEPALVGLETISYTYRELKDKIHSISDFLKSVNIVKGDRVAILGENHPNWGTVFFSVTFLGAIAVPIMTEFNPVEVHHILHHSGSKVIFISSRLLPKIEDVVFENLKTIVLLDDFSIIPQNPNAGIFRKTFELGRNKLNRIKDAAKQLTGLYKEIINEDDIASIVYTSGTTGYSKGVMLSHKNIVSNAIATLNIVEVESTDKMLSILPLSHTMECTLGLVIPIMVGASVSYLEKPPAATSLLPALEKVKPTVMLSVPLIIEKIYKSRILPEFNKNMLIRNLYKIPSLRIKLNRIAGKKLLKTFGGKLKMFCLGGAPLAEDVEAFLKEAKFPYAVGYGLTETSPLVTGTSPAYVKFQSAGKTLPGIEIKIENHDEASDVGEIFIKGPNVMKGYYRNPEAEQNIFTDDGWFRSGDLGLVDNDGYLYIKGRIKNMILGANGKNIYPEELESVINECPHVVESIVFQSDNQLAAKVHLDYKELDDEFFKRNLRESEIRAEIHKLLESIRVKVNNRVSSYSKIARFFEQTVPFEKTPTMKIKRFLYT